ncbi:flavodoxin [Saccharophagus degradans]|uniref:Flavodoxin n=1 Tax=Saccharophagus degradans TaxID=86304 RepID=A0AAW7X8L2_9GAMM|nr:flavodoxin [Saccharophagus degradans]MBU2984141.1 flavodoxin [Saccharophagus degradans]MDO6424200.1 flavodoxin [Saccharophagus degradans]MDO6608247.1 flavodoxin [Saccharophagus degradans]WGP00492.1 flavodoxin [Saccharophagus degradans]
MAITAFGSKGEAAVAAKIGLIYGSDDGNTETIAFRIQARLGEENVDVLDVSDVTQMDFASYDKLILGIPTWDFGQIQSDWEDFWDDVKEVGFEGKTVALFGLGDQFGYGDFFLDAMGMLHDVIVENGAKIVGHWPVEGYEFDASKALIEGEGLFVGLGIDEDQQPELSASRLNKWVSQISHEFNLGYEPIELDD